jgi:hypothetical protein
MGVVDRAEDLSLERPVALKFPTEKFCDDERSRLVARDESLGLLWRPRYSPDVTRVVVFRNWTNGSGEGVSVISLDKSAENHVCDGFAWPLGWSPDGRRFIFAVQDTRSDAGLIENFDPDVR